MNEIKKTSGGLDKSAKKDYFSFHEISPVKFLRKHLKFKTFQELLVNIGRNDVIIKIKDMHKKTINDRIIMQNKMIYWLTFREYNKLIERDFGKKAVFYLTTINNQKFEKQLYDVIKSNYASRIVEDEDFERELILLDANLYGHEKRNYNFLIPLIVAVFSLSVTFYNSLINNSYHKPLQSIVIVILILVLYTFYIKMKHHYYCNRITYYKLCLGIVDNLFNKQGKQN